MIDWFTPAVLTAAFLCGGIFKGLVELGLPRIALPILLLAVDVKTAVQTIAIPLVISGFAQASRAAARSCLMRRLVPVLAALVLGAVLGSPARGLAPTSYTTSRDTTGFEFHSLRQFIFARVSDPGEQAFVSGACQP
jgi:uncharacterized membrane protein YfcA